MNASLSIVIPTAGRLSLVDTLRSYAHQLGPNDEVIVVGDTTDGWLPETQEIVKQFADVRIRYLPGEVGFHTWGHFEINKGLRAARGTYVLGNDDDDVATPDALSRIRAAIALQDTPRPMLFQFVAPWRSILWAERVLMEGAIGGHCLVQPNDAVRLSEMTARYSGDFDWIARAVRAYDGMVDWVEGVVAWTRPTAEELARLVPVGVVA